MALVVRALFHWLTGNRVKVRVGQARRLLQHGVSQGELMLPGLTHQAFVVGLKRREKLGRHDVADHPMQGVVVGAVHERLARAQQSGGINWDYHRPFEPLGAVDGDELDGVTFRVDAAFIVGFVKAPVAAEVADEALQAFDAYGVLVTVVQKVTVARPLKLLGFSRRLGLSS
jgi:hypothetical protein